MRNADSMINQLICDEDEALLRVADGEAEDHTFSEKYNRKMQGLYQRSQKKRFRPFMRTFLSAGVVVVLIGGLAAGAFWEQIVSFVYRDKYVDKRIGYFTKIDDACAKELDGWSNFWIPEYIPEGFTFKEASSNDRTKMIVYCNTDDETISFQQQIGEKVIGCDSEVTYITDIKVSGQAVEAYEKTIGNKVWRNITWISENQEWLTVEGIISFSDLVKIAESLIFLEGPQ